MPIDEANLKYIGKVIGQKAHLIFEQEQYFIVFTEMDNSTRGNFFAFHKHEIDRVNRELWNIASYSQINCNSIYSRIEGLNVGKETEEQFIISRLRNICYVLTRLNFLCIERNGNNVFFRRAFRPVEPSKPPSNKPISPQPQLISEKSVQDTTTYSNQTIKNSPLISVDNDLREVFLQAYSQSNKRRDGWVSLSLIGEILNRSRIYKTRNKDRLSALAVKIGAEIRKDEKGSVIIHLND